MKIKTYKSALYAVAFITWLNTPASAFTLVRGGSGQAASKGYAGGPNISFNIDTSCNSFRGIVEDTINTAAGIWGAVPTSRLRINIGNTVTLPAAITTYVGNSASQYVPAGNPIVYCATNFASDTGEDANSIPGFASSQYVNSSGELQSGLLVLNFQGGGARSSLLNMDSVAANVVLTHEIGHIIGIGHSSDENALMYYATSAGRQSVLAKDDIDAVSYLYPMQEAPGGLACASIAAMRNGPNDFPTTGMGSTIMELLLMAAVVISLRKLSSIKPKPA